MCVNACAFASSVSRSFFTAGFSVALERDHRGDVHRGRERVVRRLPLVHVVVRVHEALLRRARRRGSRRRGSRAPRSRSCWSACPSPVCQTTSGKCSSSLPASASSAAAMIARALLLVEHAERHVDRGRGLLHQHLGAARPRAASSRRENESDAGCAGSARPTAGRPATSMSPIVSRSMRAFFMQVRSSSACVSVGPATHAVSSGRARCPAHRRP